MNFLIPGLYTLFFLWWMKKSSFFRDSGLSFSFLTLVFIIKIGAGLVLTYIYTHFYTDTNTSDLFLYYHDGKIISDALITTPSDGLRMIFGIGDSGHYFVENYYSKMERWNRFSDSVFFNDCHTIIRFDAIVQLISFGAFHAGTVIVNFISLFGLVALYKCFSSFFKGKEFLLVFSLFCVPALLFWSSSLLKEGLLVFAIGCFLCGFFDVLIRKEIMRSSVSFLITGFCFSLIIKTYFLILLFPALLSYLILTTAKVRFKFLFFSLAYLLQFALGFTICIFFLNINPIKKLIRHQHDFINMSKGGVYLYRDSIGVRLDYSDKDKVVFSGRKDTVYIQRGTRYVRWNNFSMSDTIQIKNSTDTSAFWHSATLAPANSSFYMPPLNYSFSSFINYSPSALFNAFFRPFLFESQNLYQWICSVENIFYALLILLSLFFVHIRQTDFTFFFLFFSFSISMFLLIGFTTPVSGALVRYKAPVIPFLLMAFFSLVDVEKLRKISGFHYLSSRFN